MKWESGNQSVCRLWEIMIHSRAICQKSSIMTFLVMVNCRSIFQMTIIINDEWNLKKNIFEGIWELPRQNEFERPRFCREEKYMNELNFLLPISLSRHLKTSGGWNMKKLNKKWWLRDWVPIMLYNWRNNIEIKDPPIKRTSCKHSRVSPRSKDKVEINNSYKKQNPSSCPANSWLDYGDWLWLWIPVRNKSKPSLEDYNIRHSLKLSL